MPTARQVIRDELRAIGEKRAGLKSRLASLDHEEKALKAALAALNGGPKKTAQEPRKRTFKGRVTMEKRTAQMLDLLREKPHLKWSPQDFEAAGIPSSTAIWIVENVLVPGGEVEACGETPRKKLIVKHKPKTVKPGEAVS